ncbi:hypothetical protein [Tabrizicola sp. M-4]|uniref:hypothetical protein n=1 Tax=Tabrizicola sp. M-4 TaxID=3055847 RepID=UPI003DA98A31
MFILTPDTIWNPHVLEMRQVPRRVFGRVMIFPRRGAGLGLWLRLIFEIEVLRYLGALLPFLLGAVIYPQYALAISQAPLPMLIVIYFVEAKLLRLNRTRAKALASPAEVERGMDLLRVRSVAILSKIAAGRGLVDGRLHLVVEQSEIWRMPPLTLVSVQSEAGPEVMRLTAEERSLVAGLFDEAFGERDLLRANLAAGECLRDVAFDLRGVSAHARLAALIG